MILRLTAAFLCFCSRRLRLLLLSLFSILPDCCHAASSRPHLVILGARREPLQRSLTSQQQTRDMTSTTSSTRSSWVDVSSETSASPYHVLGAAGTATTARSGSGKSNQMSSSGVLGSVDHQKLMLLDPQKLVNDPDFDPVSDPGSPVSPNSAIFETSSCSLVEAMMLNREDLLERSRRISSDWLWDWTVGVNQGTENSGTNGSEWKLSLMQQQQQKKHLSLRQWAVRKGLFSREILSVFLMSNMISLILGAGIGYAFLIRRSV